MDFVLKVQLTHNKEASFKEIKKREPDIPYPLSFVFGRSKINGYTNNKYDLPEKAIIPYVSSFQITYDYIDKKEFVNRNIQLNEDSIQIYLRFSNYPFSPNLVIIDGSFVDLKEEFVSRCLNDTPQFFYFPIKIFQDYEEKKTNLERDHFIWMSNNKIIIEEILSYAINKYIMGICLSYSKLYNLITSYEISIFQGGLFILKKALMIPDRYRNPLFIIAALILVYFIDFTFHSEYLSTVIYSIDLIHNTWLFFITILTFILSCLLLTCLTYYLISKKDLKLYISEIFEVEKSITRVVGHKSLYSSFYKLFSQIRYEVVFKSSDKGNDTQFGDKITYYHISEKFNQFEEKIIYKSQIILAVIIGILTIVITNLKIFESLIEYVIRY